MKKKEEIIEQIQKLLALANNNPHQKEAETAALMAQKLIAKHNIQLTELEKEEELEDIAYDVADTGTGKAWKYRLARVISRNFRCKHFWVGKRKVAFYGYISDASAAKEVFTFLFKMGHRLADREIHRRYAKNQPTTGTYASFITGFIDGLESKLDAQCKALMIVIDKKVEDEYQDMFKREGMRMFNAKSVATNYDIEAYQNGHTAGRSAMGRREIESCSNC